MTNTTGLQLEGIAVAAQGAVLLRDLNLDVTAGTIAAIVGPSGAGKTTMLRAIAGLMPVTSGKIRIGGADVGSIPTHRRRLAMVFQEPRLLPNLSVGENATFSLRTSGMGRRERERAAVELLDEVGLAGIADRSPQGLSGGEQQRVALARALAGDPLLLLLDEPLSAVDPKRRDDLRQLIARVQSDRSLTTLYVTHDRADAAELADTIALLIEGRIVQHGDVEDLFLRPTSAVSARFFGATNIIDVLVRDGRVEGAPVIGLTGIADGPATVVIRPEHVQVTSGSEATVRRNAFQGSHRRLVLEVDGRTLDADVPADCDPGVGALVGIVVEPRHVWVLPATLGQQARGTV